LRRGLKYKKGTKHPIYVDTLNSQNSLPKTYPNLLDGKENQTKRRRTKPKIMVKVR